MAVCPECGERAVRTPPSDCLQHGKGCWTCTNDGCDWHGRTTKPTAEEWGGDEYQARKQVLLDKWRPRVFLRDGRRCRACRSTQDVLQLAHINSALMSVKEAGSLDGLADSMRMDNLVTLCRGCHEAQHAIERDDVVTSEQRERAARVKHLFYSVKNAADHIAECFADCPLRGREIRTPVASGSAPLRHQLHFWD